MRTRDELNLSKKLKIGDKVKLSGRWYYVGTDRRANKTIIPIEKFLNNL